MLANQVLSPLGVLFLSNSPVHLPSSFRRGSSVVPGLPYTVSACCLCVSSLVYLTLPGRPGPGGALRSACSARRAPPRERAVPEGGRTGQRLTHMLMYSYLSIDTILSYIIYGIWTYLRGTSRTFDGGKYQRYSLQQYKRSITMKLRSNEHVKKSLYPQRGSHGNTFRSVIFRVSTRHAPRVFPQAVYC